jgi:hypothetical protein
MTARHAATSLALALCSLTAIVGKGHSAQGELIGGTCVPDSATVRAGIYETAGFGIRFGGNGIGKIRLLCPALETLNDVEVGATALSIIDQDGMEGGARVRAHFRRAAIGTNRWIAIGTCDSNTSNDTGPHRLLCPLPPYKLRADEWYWWDVEIERINPQVNVEFLGVGLRYIGPQW